MSSATVLPVGPVATPASPRSARVAVFGTSPGSRTEAAFGVGASGSSASSVPSQRRTGCTEVSSGGSVTAQEISRTRSLPTATAVTADAPSRTCTSNTLGRMTAAFQRTVSTPAAYLASVIVGLPGVAAAAADSPTVRLRTPTTPGCS